MSPEQVAVVFGMAAALSAFYIDPKTLPGESKAVAAFVSPAGILVMGAVMVGLAVLVERKAKRDALLANRNV